MTTAQAAKKAGVSRVTLCAKAKAAGWRPSRRLLTGKRGRPSYDWTDADIARAMRA